MLLFKYNKFSFISKKDTTIQKNKTEKRIITKTIKSNTIALLSNSTT